MKKFLSLFLAVALVMSLSVSIAAPVSAASSVGISASAIRHAYFRDKGTMKGIPIKIFAFSTRNSSVRVQVGNSTFYLPVTHKQEGSQTVSRINFTATNMDLKYGGGTVCDIYGGSAKFTITIRHYGSNVPTHTIKANGEYLVSSCDQIKYPDRMIGSSSFPVTSREYITASGSFGYYTTSFAMWALDDNMAMKMSNSTLKTIWQRGSLSHGMSSSSGLRISGRYERSFPTD